MILKDLIDYLEEIAPLRFQEKYDNAGLIYGDMNQELTGALVSLDCTEEIIDEAIANNCNVVVSHHPIVFGGIKQFDNNNYVHRTVVKAIKNDVAIYAIHTNLDNVLRSGVNEKIAKRLELTEHKILRPHPLDRMETAYTLGSGIIGALIEPMTGYSFLQHIKEKLNTQTIKHTQLIEGEVKKVAVCGGSGSFLLKDAIAAGADFFITADFKYHEFFDANGRIVIADVGHYESEYYTIELLFELLKKKFHKFAARTTKVVTNPVNYY